MFSILNAACIAQMKEFGEFGKIAFIHLIISFNLLTIHQKFAFLLIAIS